MIWSIPNLITLFRLAASLMLLYVFYAAPGPYKVLVFLFIFVFNNILDTVDGRVARRFDMMTESGKFLDAAGDRLFKTFTMCLLSYMGVFPWFLTAFHLGVKNQFFELPAFYVEGRLGESENIKKRLPLYHAITYNKPWIGFGVILNNLVWLLLIFNRFNRPFLTDTFLMALYAIFFMHSLVRTIPVVTIYAFIDQGISEKHDVKTARAQIP